MSSKRPSCGRRNTGEDGSIIYSGSGREGAGTGSIAASSDGGIYGWGNKELLMAEQ